MSSGSHPTSSTSSPCAACKFLEHNCTQECVFAPYFPADQPQRFANVNCVFEASNVAKMLNAVSPEQRKDMVNSLVYEADMRLIEPIYGCIGTISISVLQEGIIQKRYVLEVLTRMLAAYIGPAAAAAAAADAAAEAAARLAANAAVGDGAAKAAARFAADAASDASDSAASVSLGHNVFAPPPPFYQHPQQQQEQYNYQASCGVQGDEAYNGAKSSGVQMGNEDGDTATSSLAERGARST